MRYGVGPFTLAVSFSVVSTVSASIPVLPVLLSTPVISSLFTPIVATPMLALDWRLGYVVGLLAIRAGVGIIGIDTVLVRGGVLEANSSTMYGSPTLIS